MIWMITSLIMRREVCSKSVQQRRRMEKTARRCTPRWMFLSDHMSCPPTLLRRSRFRMIAWRISAVIPRSNSKALERRLSLKTLLISSIPTATRCCRSEAARTFLILVNRFWWGCWTMRARPMFAVGSQPILMEAVPHILPCMFVIAIRSMSSWLQVGILRQGRRLWCHLLFWIRYILCVGEERVFGVLMRRFYNFSIDHVWRG